MQRLIIDGQQCDLEPSGLDVQITYSNFDTERFAPSGAHSERSIDLPATKQNSLIFNRWYDALQNDPNGTKAKAMYLETGGLPTLIGTAQLREAVFQSDSYGLTAGKYKVALFGGNGDWITKLGKTKLSELDWSDLVHAYIDANVTNGFTALPSLSDYGYSIWKVKDWAASRGAAGFSVTAEDCHPFLFARTILDRIFNHVGYTWNSPFFQSQAGATVGTPILLPRSYPASFAADYLNGYWERTNTKTYTGTIGVIGAGIDFDTHDAPPQAPDPFADSVPIPPALTDFSGSYTAKVSGYYKFTWTVTVDNINIASLTSLQMAFAISGGSVWSGLGGFPDVQNGDTLSFSVIAYIPVGVTVYTFVLWGLSLDVGDTFDITYAKVEVFSDANEITYGAPIDFKHLLQDWTCADFLAGLTQAFNLQFEANTAENVVYFDPKDDYIYNDTPTFANPSGGATTLQQGFLQGTGFTNEKWDISKEAADQFLKINNVSVFRFADDGSDPTVEALQKNNIFKLYEARCTRDTARFDVGEVVLENRFFAPTLALLDTSIQHPDSVATPQISLLWNEDYLTSTNSSDKPTTYKARLMVFAGLRNNGNFIYYRDNVGNDLKIRLPECFQVNFNDLTGKDLNLSYSDEAGRIGLIRRFFMNDLARINSARQRQTYFDINATDILNLSFRKRVNIGGLNWILQRIESYTPAIRQSTKVVLLLDAAQEEGDENNLTYSTISGYLSNE